MACNSRRHSCALYRPRRSKASRSTWVPAWSKALARACRTLVQAFGAEVFDVIAQAPQRLQELDGIGPKRTARVVAAWAKLLRVVTERIPQRFGLHPIRDVQVLTPMNRGSLGARALNEVLQAARNPEATPRVTRFGWTYPPGDTVIQTGNHYDKDISNGDIGQVVCADVEAGEVELSFDGREVTYDVAERDDVALAYATTVHKSQGSEYPAVVLPLATQPYAMLARNLLDTGVTRGKQLVVLIGQPKACAMAVRNVRAIRRLTTLAVRLRQPHGSPTRDPRA